MTLSEQFYSYWIEAVYDKKEKLRDNWRKQKIFTQIIKGSQDSVIKYIADKLRLLSYEADYYCIDSIFYNKEDRVPNTVNNTYWFRDIKIAFEHENACNNRIYEEISHLLITNCLLKVFVTYPNSNAINVLYQINEIIKDTRFSLDLDMNNNFLVIFGYENNFIWEGYIYKESGWKKIINEMRTNHLT